MCIFKNWTIDNFLTLFSMILMSIGGTFALIQWISSKKLRRAEFIDQIINKLRFNKEIQKVMYLIEYDPKWYSEKFHRSELENQVDKFLSYIDYICYLYFLRNISNNEFRILKYDINRICISPSVQAYLWNLYHFSRRMNADCSFLHLIEYGIKNKIIKKEFIDNDKDLYRKLLNF